MKNSIIYRKCNFKKKNIPQSSLSFLKLIEKKWNMRHKHFNLCQNVLYSRQSRHMSSTFKPIRTVYGMVQIVLFVRNVLFVNQFLWHISVLLISQADYVDMFPICFNYRNHYVSSICFLFFKFRMVKFRYLFFHISLRMHVL